jgi:hypothetical protein
LSTQGMFDKLKASAASAANAAAEQAQKAANIAAEQAQKTASDIKARVDTAQAGKKLLDEGGEGMKKKLLAKKASIDATSADYKFTYFIGQQSDAYKDASEKMKTAGAIESDEKQAFQDLSAAYAERASSLEMSLGSLGSLPVKAATSPAETDAISILTAKMTVMGAPSQARRLSKELVGSGSAEADTAATNDAEGEQPETTTRQSTFMEAAKDKAKAVQARATERIGNANAGKKLVDEGGEQIVTTLLAKRASRDSTAADKRVVEYLKLAISLYEDAESQLKEAAPQDSGDDSPTLSSLLETHSKRREELQTVLAKIEQVPEAISIHESENDGIGYLMVKLNLKDAQEQASAQFAATLTTAGQAASAAGSACTAAGQAAGGYVASSPPSAPSAS